jgi:hypothetical protein
MAKTILTREKFIEILTKYKGKKTFIEIAEIINKNYTTADGRVFTATIIADRARDAGLVGYSKITNLPLRIKELKNLSTKQNIKLYNKGDISLDLFRKRAVGRKSDARRSPEIKAKRAKAEKARYQADMATEEGRAKRKVWRVTSKAKEYKVKGIDPPATTATEALWKDIVKTGKDNLGEGRFSQKGWKKSLSRADFFSDRIKITDSVTGETFTFGENIESKGNKLKNFINKNAKSFGIANFQEAVKPHQQKAWINAQGLRNSINEQLMPGWTKKSKRNAFTVQHSLGRQTNPLKTSLAFWDANEQEWGPRKKFNDAWDKNIKASATGKIKVTPGIKEALKAYKTKIGELGIESQPLAATRATRAPFGTSFLLDEILRGAKAKGAVLPKGVLKQAAGFEKVLLDYAKTNKGNVCQLFLNKGGRAGFAAGSNCVLKMSDALERDPIGVTRQITKLPGNKTINTVKNSATSFLKLLGRGGLKAAPLAAVAAVGAGIEPLVKQFRNDDPTTYLTDESQMKGMLLATIEGETPKVDEEILKWQYPGLGAATIAGAVPGAEEVYRTRQGIPPHKFIGPMEKGVGPVRAALGIKGVLGKALGASFSPLAAAATLPISVAAQREGGTEWGDIATDPMNWMGPAFASSGAEMATRGMKPTGILAKAIRMGISPRTLSLVSRRFGMPGLAVSAGMWGYDKWKNRSINDED